GEVGVAQHRAGGVLVEIAALQQGVVAEPLRRGEVGAEPVGFPVAIVEPLPGALALGEAVPALDVEGGADTQHVVDDGNVDGAGKFPGVRVAELEVEEAPQLVPRPLRAVEYRPPPVLLRPNRVPWGPFSTCRDSRSKNWILAPARPTDFRGTSLKYTTTPDAEPKVAPWPRMKKSGLVRVAEPWRTTSPGTWKVRS